MHNNISYNLSPDAKIGKSLAKALCDYYRHIGVIPPRVGSKSKKKETRGRRRRKRPVIERERSGFNKKSDGSRPDGLVSGIMLMSLGGPKGESRPPPEPTATRCIREVGAANTSAGSKTAYVSEYFYNFSASPSTVYSFTIVHVRSSL